MYRFIKYFLFLLPPELSHKIALKLLKYFSFLFAKYPYHPKKVMGINFYNSIGLAAGFDKNGDYIAELFNLGFGFLEIGTVTPRPQNGNVKPRIFRSIKYQSILNRMGFNNKGVAYLVNKVMLYKNQYKACKKIIGISIGKNADTPIEFAVEDYLLCLEKVYNVADYVAINISSPNTANLTILQTKEYFSNIILQIKNKQQKLYKKFNKYTPIAIKISPDLEEKDLLYLINIINLYKVDGIITCNTSSSYKLKQKNGFFSINNQGGISGKPLAKISIRFLCLCKKHLDKDIAIINTGGIFDFNDAKDRFELGADLIQVYTGFIYNGPKIITDIANIA